MLKDKQVVVTGSEGFIGKRLVKALIAQDIKVVGIDKSLGFDINNKRRLAKVMIGATHVFHLAVLPFNPCAQKPRDCIKTNIFGTLNIVEVALDAGVRKFIYSSASAVYGNIDKVKNVDETNPCNPDTMYGSSKLMGEIIIKNSGIPYIILRYMNVYGSGQINGLIPSVIKSVGSNVSPTIKGDGLQAFDFVHVDDVVVANILAMNSNIVCETFNIGGENEVTINDVVKEVTDAFGVTLIPNYQAGVPARRVGSSAKAGEKLGYYPKIKFGEGIKELVNEYTNNKTIHG